MSFAAFIFDVDGVLVDSPHEEAWRQTLHELMAGAWATVAQQSTYTPDRFDSALYQSLVSGKPRDDGARSILQYFSVPDAENRAHEYARRKQEKVVALIQEGRFDEYPDAIRFVLDVMRLGIPMGAASSSKNATDLMQRIRIDAPDVRPGTTLLDLFTVNLSGQTITRGKPYPDLFLATASALGKPPNDCVVVEDAVAGIVAAKAGQMHALAVARREDGAVLRVAGADLVVRSLDLVRREALAKGQLDALSAEELAA